MAELGSEFQFEFGGDGGGGAVEPPTVELTPNYRGVWLEVEGIPFAFGIGASTAEFFAARPSAQRRLGVRAAMIELPSGVEQEVRPLEGEGSLGEMSVLLADIPDVVAMFANAARAEHILVLGAALPGSAALVDIPFTGAADPVQYPAAGGTIYIGRETLTYQSRVGQSFVGCARQQYQIPAHPHAYVHAAGEFITPYPRHLASRRAALFLSETGHDDARTHVWAGSITQARSAIGMGAFEVQLASAEREIQVTVFRDQITGKLSRGISTDREGTAYEGGDGEPAPTGLEVVFSVGSLEGREWTAGEPILVRIDNELIEGTLNIPAAGEDPRISIYADGRGVFGSPVEQHRLGSEVREVIFTGKTGTEPGFRSSRFWAGDNPIEIVLQLLLSRGTGNSTWDTLPEWLGAGVEQSAVLIEDALNLRDEWLSGERYLAVIDEEFTVKEMIARILRPYLCFIHTRRDDLITIGRIRPPLSDEVVASLTPSSIAEVPTWDAAYDQIVGRVRWLCDYDPEEGKYRQRFHGEFPETQALYAGQFKEVEVEAEGCWTGNDERSGRYASQFSTGARSTADRYIRTLQMRFGYPYPLISVECDWDALAFHVGSFVRLTCPHVPNVVTGQRGFVDELCEVLRARAIPETGKVEVVLLHAPYGEKFRRVAPSAVIVSANAALPLRKFQLWQHQYSDQVRPQPYDWAAFKVGDVVDVWSRDLNTLRGTRTITEITFDGAVTLHANVLGPVLSGDVLTMAAFGFANDRTKALYSFFDNAQEYAP